MVTEPNKVITSRHLFTNDPNYPYIVVSRPLNVNNFTNPLTKIVLLF